MAADPAADEAFLSTLRILEREADGTFRPARPLTAAERELHQDGKLANTVRGEILRADIVAAREAERMARERARASTKATKAEVEARRLTAEAERWRSK